MKRQVILVSLFALFVLPAPVQARTTPNDIYQQRQEEFRNDLAKIQNPTKKDLVIKANSELYDINQQICDRFEIDIYKMAAVLDEEKKRQGVTHTIVAYGQGNTPLDQAAYYLNYAEEALAYQRIQDYTPNLSNGDVSESVVKSKDLLENNLEVLQEKILTAKAEINKALDYYEK